ncbi:MAG: hypothetical protein ACAH95_13190 [Fimbriimonas sp.]
MKVNPRSFILVGALAVAGAAQAQNPFDLGASVGIFMPSSGTIRNAFGSQILKFGFGGVGQQSTGNLKIGTEFDIMSANKNGNRLLIMPFVFTGEQQLAMEGAVRPYIKPFAGLAYIDYGINVPGGRKESKVIRVTYGLEGGIVLSQKLRLSARYSMFQNSGFDFNGLTLSATFSLR